MITFIKKKWSYYFNEPVRELKDRSQPFLTRIKALAGNGNSSLYRLLFASAIVFLLFFMPAVSFDFGRNSDETVSNNYGKDILSFYRTAGKDKSVFNTNKQGYSHMIYYGLSFDLLCAFVNKYLSPYSEFNTRHLLNSLFGLITILFAALTAKKLSSRRTAFLTVIFMFLSPVFFGHSMNNAKDIPFAAGYIMSVYMMIVLFQKYPEIKLKEIFLLSLAIGLTGSNKINGWLLLNVYVLFFLLLIIVYHSFKQKNNDELINSLRKAAFPVIMLITISYFLSIALWPYAYADIIRRPLESMKTFENVSRLMIHYELFDGNLINMELVPWFYTFKLMIITIPVFILAGFLLTVFSIKWIAKKLNLSILGLLFFVTIMPVLYSVYQHSELYNGWRHFLFIFPSFAILSAAGWEFVFQKVKIKSLKYSLIVLLIFFAFKTTVWSIVNHPNEISYYNELTGGTSGAYGYFELDPLATSGRQAIEWLLKYDKNTRDTIIVMSNIEGESLQYYANEKHRKVKVYWTKGINTCQVNWKYLIMLNTGMSHTQLTSGAFPPKGTIHKIKSGNATLIVIVKKDNDYRFIAYNYFQKKNYDSAAYYFTRALASDSNDVEANDLLASSYINLAQYNKAFIYLNRTLNLFPEDYFAWENVGAIYMNKQDFPKAVKYYKKAIEYRVNAKTALINIGKCYVNTGDLDSAIYYLTWYDKYFPGDVQLYSIIADIYLKKGDVNSALDVYNKALSIRPDDKEIAMKREEAINSMVEGRFNKEFNLAMKYANAGKFDSTIKVLSQVIIADSLNYTAFINRGVAWYQKGNIRQAFLDFDQAIKINPNTPDAYLKKGQIYVVQNDNKKGLEEFNTALKLSPGNYEILLEIGNIYFNNKEYNEAIDYFNKSISAKPDFEKPYYSRGVSWYSLGEYNKALDDMNSAIQLEHNNFDAYSTRAVLYFSLKRYDDALKDIQFLKQNNYPVDPKLVNEINNMLKK